jgi:hypothetical protein
MAPGTTRTIAATYTVARGSAAPPEITNAATVLSGISDPNPANNRATISTTIRIRAQCDVDGDGLDEIITGAGPGGGPHVIVWSLAGGVVTPLASFYAYDPLFSGGVYVACGDVDGDGLADVITGAGPGGSPHVRAFSLAGGTPTEVASFFAYDSAFAGGVGVAAGDVTGDGVAEIITGAGPGGGPHVRAFSLAGGVITEVASFFAYDPAFAGGVSVAAGDGPATAWPRSPWAGPVAGRMCAFGVAGGVTEVASFAYDPAFGAASTWRPWISTVSCLILPGFLSPLTPAILRPSEPHDDAGVQHATVAADVARKALRADGRAYDLILPREEVGAGAGVRRAAIRAEETTIVTLFRPPVARDVPVSAGRAPLARAGWLQSTVERRLHQGRRARAPP